VQKEKGRPSREVPAQGVTGEPEAEGRRKREDLGKKHERQ